jgi:23S rRNA (cytidine2498-2'-O)-methyltransferase
MAALNRSTFGWLFSRPPSKDRGVSPNPFYFTVCQVGAEKALKEEMARVEPGLRFAFSRPGFVTFKLAEGQGVPEWNPSSVFARAFGLSVGKVSELQSWLADIQANPLSSGKAPYRLHVWERDIALPGDEPLGYRPAEESTRLEAQLRHAAPGLFLEGAQARPGETVVDLIVLERGDESRPTELAWGYHLHQAGRSPWPGGKVPLQIPERSPSRAWLKLEEMVDFFKAPLRAGDLAVEVGSAPGGVSHALLERGLSVIGIDPGDMAEPVRSHPRFKHIAEAVNAVRRESLPESIQWILLDMNVKPDVSLFAVDRLVSRAGPDLLGVLLTVKLNDWKYAREIPQMIKHVEAMGLYQVQAAQLASHRREIAIAGFTRKGWMRTGRALSQVKQGGVAR